MSSILNLTMNKLIDRLNVLARRHERFIFDLRGNCLVYTGVIAAYQGDPEIALEGDPSMAIVHALDHDGIVCAWKEGGSGPSRFASCRLFTDQTSALRFAHKQQQTTVFNLNRDLEVRVEEECLPWTQVASMKGTPITHQKPYSTATLPAAERPPLTTL